MKNLTAIAVSLFMALAVGCSSKWEVKDITKVPTAKDKHEKDAWTGTDEEERAAGSTGDSKPGVKPASEGVDGVPFRMKVLHTVRLFKRNADGSYEQVKVFHRMLPDMQKLYVLNVWSDIFADHTAKIAFRPDGTIDNLNLTTESKGAETLDDITEAMTTVTDKFIEQQKLEKEAEEAQKTKAAESKAASQEALLAAIDAKHAVEALQDKINALPDDADIQTRSDLNRQLYKAQVYANLMYKNAGFATVPYPDTPYPK